LELIANSSFLVVVLSLPEKTKRSRQGLRDEKKKPRTISVRGFLHS
jgi:hypothetical protein